MAQEPLQFLTNDNLTRKKWAKDLFRLILPATEFNDLVGTGSESIIQMRTELGKGEGDAITFGIRLPLIGEGVVGNDTVEGNEERLRFRDFKATIEELNHAVDTGGRFEEQRIPWNLMQEAKTALQEWWADRLSAIVFATLCGDSTFRVAGKTFAQDPTEPDTNHILRVNDAATDAAVASTDVMDLTFLDRMKQQAETPLIATGSDNMNNQTRYKIRPLMIGGKAYYRVILHNYVFDRLRQNMNAGQWGDLLRSAQKLQQPNVEFEYNGMLVSKSMRIRKCATNQYAYRNLLLGAQAAVFAWGGAGESKSSVMSFVPYTKDAERFMMVRGGGIFGCAKTRFNTVMNGSTYVDFGTLVGVSYATPLT